MNLGGDTNTQTIAGGMCGAVLMFQLSSWILYGKSIIIHILSFYPVFIVLFDNSF